MSAVNLKTRSLRQNLEIAVAGLKLAENAFRELMLDPNLEDQWEWFSQFMGDSYTLCSVLEMDISKIEKGDCRRPFEII